MTSESVLGKCEACGHHVRIPHSDHVYACKSCGGRVLAMAQTSAELKPVSVGAEHAPHRSSAPLSTPAAKEHHAHPVERAHGARHREHGESTHGHPHHHHVHRRSIPSWLLTILIALVIGGAGVGTYKVLWAGHGVDLNATQADFVEAWNKGDLGAMADFHHPQDRSAFRERLAAIAAHRAWTTGFPPIERQSASITSGTPEKPDRGASMLVFGKDWARLEWQFESSRNMWVIYALDVTPYAILPRVEGFRTAWSGSNLGDLQPFLRVEARTKWNELLTRKLASLKWTGAHPALGAPRIVGEEKAKNPLEILSSSRVEVFFPLADGREFRVNWGFHGSADEWFITGFEFP